MKTLRLFPLVLLPSLLVRATSVSNLRELQDSGNDTRKLQTSCSIEAGIEYLGNDIRSVIGRPMSACCDECASTTGCVLWSWNAAADGTCWLKSGKYRSRYSSDFWSATLTTNNPESTCQLQQDIDYIDHDIASVPANAPCACCDLCRAYVGCKAFAWNGFNGGTCWLKNEVGSAVVRRQVWSGYIQDPRVACAATLQYNTDILGNDLGSVQDKDPSNCCAICRSKPQCKAFSWSGYLGGTCWLKYAKEPTRTAYGIISAVI